MSRLLDAFREIERRDRRLLLPLSVRVGRRVEVRRPGASFSVMVGIVTELDVGAMTMVVRDDAGHGHVFDLLDVEVHAVEKEGGT